MNKIDFTYTGGFPFTQDTLNFMQEAYNKCFLAIGSVLGNKVIISGCHDNGTGVISAGVVALNGEILPTPGGSAATVFVEENCLKQVAFQDGLYRNVYFTRTLEFGLGDQQCNWSEFVRIETIRTANEKVEMLLDGDRGVAKPYMGLLSQLPAEHLICDGRTLVINEYPRLFAKLGNQYGGNGTTTFNLPNLKGRFLVGYDANTASSPSNQNNKTINYGKVGNTGGLQLVKLTPNEQGSYRFGMKSGLTDNAYVGGYWGFEVNGKQQGTTNDYQWDYIESHPRDDAQAHENRPPYMVSCYIIRY